MEPPGGSADVGQGGRGHALNISSYLDVSTSAHRPQANVDRQPDRRAATVLGLEARRDKVDRPARAHSRSESRNAPNRAPYESSLPPAESKPVRWSSGSRPLNHDASSFTAPGNTPTVTTPNVICVPSCQWWEIGASGSAAAEGRCGKATGPTAGSATGAR